MVQGLRSSSTNDADETVIAEYPIDGSCDPVILDPEPSQDTYLAATCWGENKRCLFFQKGLIKMVDINAGSGAYAPDLLPSLTET
jgi:hypothetical protein